MGSAHSRFLPTILSVRIDGGGIKLNKKFLAGLLVVFPSLLWAQTLEIHHINIGQGDATLILGPVDSSGNRVSVLMDSGDRGAGGNMDGGLVVGEYLAELGINEINFFIASHYDADHIGGVGAGNIGVHGHSFVLGPNNVPGAVGDDDGDGDVDWTDGNTREAPDPEELGLDDDILVHNWIDRGDASTPDTATFRKYRGIATNLGIRTSLVGQTEVNAFSIDLGGGATMTAVAANGFVRNRATRVASIDTENEKSLGFWLQFGRFDYLICGDLIGRSSGSENAKVELAVGQFLVSQNAEIDELHVNHHGANNTSDKNFLDLIQPEVAIISAGNVNTHGHPRKENFRRLSDAGVDRILLTNYGKTGGFRRGDVKPLLAIAQSHIVITVDGSSYTTTVRETFSFDE